MKKNSSFKLKHTLLLAAAIVLLLASAVGSTQAALTYYSQTYTAGAELEHIGVTLVENNKDISWRDYVEEAEWRQYTGVLLENMLDEEDNNKLALGKEYEEVLTVRNTGGIDTYVRVILTKSWKDENGIKNTALSPELIDLNVITGSNDWIIDKSATTAERVILYYTKILEKGETAPAFTDTLRIDPSIGTKVSETVDTKVKDGVEYTMITYTYEYDGYTFEIQANVDAVQTHNVVDAVKSAWGVDVKISENGILSLEEEVQE